MIRSYEIWWIMYIWPNGQKTFRHLDNGPVIVDVGHKRQGQKVLCLELVCHVLPIGCMDDRWVDI